MKRAPILLITAVAIIATAFILPGCDELITENITVVEAGHPMASFVLSQTRSCTTFVCTLADSSRGPVDSAEWRITRVGDTLFDTTITLVSDNPNVILDADTTFVFTEDKTGYYTIRLTIWHRPTEGVDTEVKQRAVFMGNSLLGFTASDSVVCLGDTVTFTPIADDITRLSGWQWFFDTVAVTPQSTQDTVKWVYSEPGLYTVQVRATDDSCGGSRTIIDSNLIRVVQCPPALTITLADGDTAVGCAPHTVAIYDSTVLDTFPGTIISRTWTFNNQSVTIGPDSSNITPTFDTGGVYDITLETDLEYFSGSENDTLTVSEIFAGFVTVYDTSSAAFSALTATETCHNPFQQFLVVLQADAPGTYDSLYWDFGDGTFDTSTSDSLVVHGYNSPGRYSVSLEVVGACNRDTVIDSNLVSIWSPIDPADVAFSIDPPDSAVVGSTVTFTDLTTGMVKQWDWDFGDGVQTTDTSSVIQHVFTDTTTYTITLTVSNTCGSQQVSMDYKIVPVPPAATSTRSVGRTDN